MKLPHRRGGREPLPMPRAGIAPGKRRGFELARGTREGAAEIIVRVRMSARKTGTACAQDGGDLGSAGSVPQQFLGDPFIGDAPIRLREAFGNVQPVQPIGIDAGGCRMDQRRCG